MSAECDPLLKDAEEANQAVIDYYDENYEPQYEKFAESWKGFMAGYGLFWASVIHTKGGTLFNPAAIAGLGMALDKLVSNFDDLLDVDDEFDTLVAKAEENWDEYECCMKKYG